MSKSRNIPRRAWTDVEKELLTRNYADSRTEDLAKVLGRPVERVLAKANTMGLKKSRALIAEIAREKMTDPQHGGRAHQFAKGMVPANKGKKMPPGWAPGRMAQTQFTKGSRPHTWVPVGSYTINSDGHLDQKVNDDPGPRHVRWKPVHRLVWEAAHGPVPSGHTVVFKPGRATAVLELITLDAVELLTRAELMARNTIHHRYPAELKQLINLKGAVKAQITRRLKKAATTAGEAR